MHALVEKAGKAYNIQSSQVRMPTERCAELMAKGEELGMSREGEG